MTALPAPRTLGLFEKRFAGDDALMELAALRFRRARMGAEMHAANPDQLEDVLRFRPSPDAPVVVHLPRNFVLADERTRKQVVDFASRFARRVYGWVLHDHPELASRPDIYKSAAVEMDSQLQRLASSPILFVEYAAGLEPAAFASFFESIRDLPLVSACIDTGHVGIRQVRAAYAKMHSGEDVCAIRSEPAQIQSSISDVESAVATALPTVLSLIETLATFAKPLHFHLHDGHPLSIASPFGVSDHLGFFAEIPLGFEYHGRRSVPPMFGPSGLSRIASTVAAKLGLDRASLTLEIHPTLERLPLEDAAPLFVHWTDKTHAEQMNHWFRLLSQNHQLLLDALAPPPQSRPRG